MPAAKFWSLTFFWGVSYYMSSDFSGSADKFNMLLNHEWQTEQLTLVSNFQTIPIQAKPLTVHQFDILDGVPWSGALCRLWVTFTSPWKQYTESLHCIQFTQKYLACVYWHYHNNNFFSYVKRWGFIWNTNVRQDIQYFVWNVIHKNSHITFNSYNREGHKFAQIWLASYF